MTRSLPSEINTIDWIEPDRVRIIDQTKIPSDFSTIEIINYTEMEGAIKNMLIRGAPAIGIAGAFGLVLAANDLVKNNSKEQFITELINRAEFLKNARPTAVNLEWAINHLLKLVDKNKSLEIDKIVEKLKTEAIKMHSEDLYACKTIGKNGAEIIPEGATILTHCNAGGLATVGYGTALGVIRAAYKKDPTIKVFADETRPRQQGARLTTWELLNEGINTTLITDGMCAYFMSHGMIDVVVVGADRIASNGDAANKIGTYTVAIVAKEFKIPFYVAAPVSTIDPDIPDGTHIPIEEREKEEVTIINGEYICPEDVNIINPAFDVTPARYIAGIITEKGILRPDYTTSIASLFAKV
ncbi:MAG: S-methyl-5-thioribose-1-phosphate isomerase [Cyanobacteriota bacterium]